MMYFRSLTGRSGKGITLAWKNAKGTKTGVIRSLPQSPRVKSKAPKRRKLALKRPKASDAFF
jgi:hypothetical protein